MSGRCFLRLGGSPHEKGHRHSPSVLVADLDSEKFAVREAASQELGKYDAEVEPLLRKALESNPPAEARKRLDALLARPRAVPSPETLRGLRAIQALEHIGTGEAQLVLKELAQGAPEARLTQDAKASLERLAKRAATDP